VLDNCLKDVAAPECLDVSCVQYYSFTTFALLLNEIDDQLKAKIAPTDSRYRPDMRRMEEGDFGVYMSVFTKLKA